MKVIRLNQTMNSDRLMLFLIVILLATASIVYSAMVTSASFGATHDDSIYVTTAKAVATGEGYRIISLPDEPAQTKYPPFYPFLLSLIWRVYPQFPQNLTLMMLVSVLATVSFLALSYRYMVDHEYATRWQALIVVCLCALNWRTFVLATAIFSEMVYAALSVTALYLAEKYERENKSQRAGAMLGVVLGLAFLTRNSGISLLAAVGVYFVLRRQWRRALLPILIGSVFVLGWIGWCYVNKSSVESPTMNYYTSYYRVSLDVISDMQMANHSSKVATVLTLVLKNAIMLLAVTPPVICMGLTYDWPQLLTQNSFKLGLGVFIIVLALIVLGFRRLNTKRCRLLHLYVLLYMAPQLFWPFPIYDRFLMPLLPFLLLFMVAELTTLFSVVRKQLGSATQRTQRISAAFVGLAMLMVAGVIPWTYWLGANQFRSYSRHMAAGALQDAEAMEWIQGHSDTSDVLLCDRDPKYYLYTNRKATRTEPMRGDDLLGHRDVSDQVVRIIEDSRATYLILRGAGYASAGALQLESFEKAYEDIIQKNSKGFIPVYAASDGSFRIYQIDRSGGPIQ